ncbi:MAG: nickel-dependent hydrogenase large subunit, partial [Anaerolineae bacterium]
MNINVHHVTRVEGHGNIVVDTSNGEIKECRFEVVEAPRFFEAFVRERPYYEINHITSRICGICAVGHSTTSAMATEKALDVKLTEQAELLRKLNFHGEIIDSHVLHTYYLVAPDFFGVGSVVPLVDSHREVVERALRIKKLSGDLCAMIGGRHTHPCALVVGGFTHTPTEDDLLAMRQRFVDARADMDATADVFSTLPWPEFERDTEYVSLTKDDEYAFVGGTIKSSDGFTYPVEDYKKVT